MGSSFLKPLIVGGNSGIGLALAYRLFKEGAEKIYIVGKDDLKTTDIDKEDRDAFLEKVFFVKHNFVSFDLNIFKDITDIDSLIITAGFGRVALFQDIREEELANLLNVNFNSVTRILRHYYEKIANPIAFHTIVMVSICGQIVSPFFSAYGASKGGLRFLIENLNCELREQGYTNRILDVSPGAIGNTGFNGGRTHLEALDGLVAEILLNARERKELFIPKYEDVYRGVIERYDADPISFGKESFAYKNKSGRIATKPQLSIGYLSGTFDLFHIGHLNLLRRAKEQCDYLIVSVHESGAWKGKETFIPYEERKAIVQSIKYVDEVVKDYIEDCDAWNDVHYNKLFVGSDYKGTERFNRYEKVLAGKAEIVYFPYTKGTSSTQLRDSLNSLKKR